MNCAVCGDTASRAHLGSPLCLACEGMYTMDGDQVVLGDFAAVLGTICAAVAILAMVRIRIDELAAKREDEGCEED